MNRSEIYAALVEMLPSAQLPERWRACPIGPDIYAGASDGPALSARLEQRFGHEQLRQAGILRSSSGDQPVNELHPDLMNPRRTIIGLRSEAGQIYDLVTSTGCISRRTLPVIACLEDAYSRRAFGHAGELIICTSTADVAILRSIGFAATTAHGLTRITGPWLSALCRTFQIVSDYDLEEEDLDEHMAVEPRELMITMPDDISPGMQGEPDDEDEDEDDFPEGLDSEHDARHDEPQPPHLAAPLPSAGGQEVEEPQPVDGPPACWTFLGWSPAQWTFACHPALADIVRQLEELSTHLGLEFPELRIWQPSEVDVASLEFALGHGTLNQIRGVCGGIMHRFSQPVVAAAKPSPSETLHGLLLTRPGDRLRHERLASAARSQILDKLASPLLARLDDSQVPPAEQAKLLYALAHARDLTTRLVWLLAPGQGERPPLKETQQLMDSFIRLLDELFPGKPAIPKISNHWTALCSKG